MMIPRKKRKKPAKQAKPFYSRDKLTLVVLTECTHKKLLLQKDLLKRDSEEIIIPPSCIYVFTYTYVVPHTGREEEEAPACL